MDDGEEYEDEDEEESEGGGGIPIELIKGYVTFGLLAIKKRRLLIAAVFVPLAALVVGIVAILPSTYLCEGRLMASHNRVLSQDDTTQALRSAPDVIKRLENLEGIVDQLDLIRLHRENRPKAVQAKERIAGLFRDPPTEKELRNALIWTLEDRIEVTPSFQDGTVSISAQWTDPNTAARIVEVAIQNYLEDRHVAEISTIAEYVSILEGHAARLRGEVEEIADQLRELVRKQVVIKEEVRIKKEALDRKISRGSTAPPIRRPRPSPIVGGDSDEDAARVSVLLEAKKRTLQELEQSRRTNQADVDRQLAQLRTQYTEAHPSVLEARRRLAVLQKDTPQVTALRGDIEELEAKLQKANSGPTAAIPQRFGGSVGTKDKENETAGPLPSEFINLLQQSEESLDPAITAQLRYAVDEFSSIRRQISNGRVDLDTAHAAFKHRYKVVVPPDPPKVPIKPKKKLIAGGGLLVALVLALVIAISSELLTGRIVERWQVEGLQLPVLAELRLPPAPEQQDN